MENKKNYRRRVEVQHEIRMSMAANKSSVKKRMQYNEKAIQRAKINTNDK